MESVASVVMNRLGHDGFPNTVCEVVKQGHGTGRVPVFLVVRRAFGPRDGKTSLTQSPRKSRAARSICS